MADTSGSYSPMRATASAVLALALSACSLWPAAEPEPLPPAPLDTLVDSLQEFVAADAAGRSAIYVDAVAALAQEPTAERRLHLALLQGWPGHEHSRPDNALRLTDQVLDDTTLDASVRDVAHVLRFWIASHQVDQRRQRALNHRVAELEARIDELRQQLQELTEIERSVEPPR